VNLRDLERLQPTFARVWREHSTIPLDELIVEWALSRIERGVEDYLGDGVGEAVLAAHVDVTRGEIAHMRRFSPGAADYHERALRQLEARAERAREKGAAEAATLARHLAERSEQG